MGRIIDISVLEVAKRSTSTSKALVPVTNAKVPATYYNPTRNSSLNEHITFKSVQTPSAVVKPSFTQNVLSAVPVAGTVAMIAESGSKTLADWYRAKMTEINPDWNKNTSSAVTPDSTNELPMTSASNSSSTDPSSSSTTPGSGDSGSDETLLSVLANANNSYKDISNFQNANNTYQSVIAESSIEMTKNSQIYSDSNLSQFIDMNTSLKLQNELLEYDIKMKQLYADNNLTQFIEISGALNSISQNLKAISEKENSNAPIVEALGDIKKGVTINRSENETMLTDKKLEHITYDTTAVQLDNMGEDIPKATPQQYRALKDVAVAKKNSDENTFKLDDDELDEIFGGMPDISSIFKIEKKTDRLSNLYNEVKSDG